MWRLYFTNLCSKLFNYQAGLNATDEWSWMGLKLLHGEGSLT
jgi:hypothetical protein